MLKSLALAAALACVGYVALAQDASNVIRRPDWAAKPTGEDVASHYPDRAAAKDVSGWAVISCRVDGRGFLKGCRVAAEAPEGWEFGAATLALSSKFRMRNAEGDTKALEGGKVRIPVAWILEGNPPPPKNATPGAPSVLLVEVADASGPGVFACPVEGRPQQRCEARSLSWAQQPVVEDIATQIRAAGEGRSLLECVLDAEGVPHNCRAQNKSRLPDAELLNLARLFKAPPATTDGTQTAGRRVALTFEWKVLAQVLAVVEAT